MVEHIQHEAIEQPPANAQPFLEITDLTFGYTAFPLLYGVQVSIGQGEMVGLLGPNGSGKTTLLRLVSGLLRPRQGRILLEGRELANWGRRGLARRVAVVPQELQVPFAFTVEHMVSLGRTPFVSLFGARSRHDHEIVRDALRVADVDGLAERVFNELSGGERQRVLLAMALAQQPRLLLLDEPTSHLDIKYQIDMLELVSGLNRSTGVTVVAAMHDLNLAARYFPRLLLFQRGVVADGGPAEVLEPHLLRRVYGVTVRVGVMHGSEHISVLPPGDPALGENTGLEVPRVHVMAGGGTGGLMMRALADAHMSFRAGALNIGDSDHTLALRLASEVITEQPFAPISAATHQKMQDCLHQVSLLIVCPMPLGPGNLVLLQEALSARQRGLPVLLLRPFEQSAQPQSGELALEERVSLLDGERRDYAHGEGSRLLHRLVEAGALVLDNLGEVIACARRVLAEKSLEDL